MPEIKTNKDAKPANDGLALIIGGLFVLALVFATYSYFNKGAASYNNFEANISENEDENKPKDDQSLGDRIKELFAEKSVDRGELNGDGASTQKEEIKPQITDQKVNAINNDYTNLSEWTANDYKIGDITGNSYVVRSGDTLWEIAQAKYGNGLEWTKILEANKSQIGYLPSGEQALIVVGQTIVLP